jgi:acyl-[acyl-carrier-protein]-phospholipid O-acyltransferase/long-chain-fatty-acid--[acyl-carrier-protein] ligase
MQYTGWKKRIRDLLLGCLSRLYRVSVQGGEVMPPQGTGVLLVCNHVSYVDAIVLQIASPRTIRFLSFDEFFRVPLLGLFLRLFKAIPISSRHAKDAVVKAAEALRQGEVVCIFPEGKLTQSGELQEFQKGFELIARKAQVPVLPVYLGSLWDSIFSYQGGHPFWKWPRHVPFHTQVRFGGLIPFAEADTERVRREVLGLGKTDIVRKKP